MMLVAVQLSVLGLYLPPMFRLPLSSSPPQTIISLASPHCRVAVLAPAGALVVLVAVQLSLPGLYLPPVFKRARSRFRPRRSFHCRSTLPCETSRASGALVVFVAVQLSVPGLYLPPVFESRCCGHIRPRRSFHCRSTLLCDGSGQLGAWWCWWLSNCQCSDYIFHRC